MLNDDDNDDFKRAMSDVTPLHQDKHEPFQHKPKHKKANIKKSHQHSRDTSYVYDVNLINQDNWVGGEDPVYFKQTGVQKKIMDKLRRGIYPIEARIDLHRFTAGEAVAQVDRFIEVNMAANKRCLLIVHGKGYMSRNDKPILKNILIEYLRQHKNVLAYQSAQPRDGGTGALYVLIKSAYKVK